MLRLMKDTCIFLMAYSACPGVVLCCLLSVLTLGEHLTQQTAKASLPSTSMTSLQSSPLSTCGSVLSICVARPLLNSLWIWNHTLSSWLGSTHTGFASVLQRHQVPSGGLDTDWPLCLLASHLFSPFFVLEGTLLNLTYIVCVILIGRAKKK